MKVNKDSSIHFTLKMPLVEAIFTGKIIFRFLQQVIRVYKVTLMCSEIFMLLCQKLYASSFWVTPS